MYASKMQILTLNSTAVQSPPIGHSTTTANTNTSSSHYSHRRDSNTSNKNTGGAGAAVGGVGNSPAARASTQNQRSNKRTTDQKHTATKTKFLHNSQGNKIMQQQQQQQQNQKYNKSKKHYNNNSSNNRKKYYQQHYSQQLQHQQSQQTTQSSPPAPSTSITTATNNSMENNNNSLAKNQNNINSTTTYIDACCDCSLIQNTSNIKSRSSSSSSLIDYNQLPQLSARQHVLSSLTASIENQLRFNSNSSSAQAAKTSLQPPTQQPATAATPALASAADAAAAAITCRSCWSNYSKFPEPSNSNNNNSSTNSNSSKSITNASDCSLNTSLNLQEFVANAKIIESSTSSTKSLSHSTTGKNKSYWKQYNNNGSNSNGYIASNSGTSKDKYNNSDRNVPLANYNKQSLNYTNNNTNSQTTNSVSTTNLNCKHFSQHEIALTPEMNSDASAGDDKKQDKSIVQENKTNTVPLSTYATTFSTQQQNTLTNLKDDCKSKQKDAAGPLLQTSSATASVVDGLTKSFNTSSSSSSSVSGVPLSEKSAGQSSSSNSYTLDFLHSVGVQMTTGGAASSSVANKSNTSTVRNMTRTTAVLNAYAGKQDQSSAISPSRRNYNFNGMTTPFQQRPQRYLFSGNHHHHYHPQPTQLTIASFLQKDLFGESILGSATGVSNQTSHTNTNYTNAQQQEKQYQQQQQRQQQYQQQQNARYNQNFYYQQQRQPHQSQASSAFTAAYSTSSSAGQDMSRLSSMQNAGGCNSNVPTQKTPFYGGYQNYHNNNNNSNTLSLNMNARQQTGNIGSSMQKKSNASNLSSLSCTASSSSSSQSSSSNNFSFNNQKQQQQIVSSKNQQQHNTNIKSLSSSSLNLVIETLPSSKNLGYQFGGNGSSMQRHRGGQHSYRSGGGSSSSSSHHHLNNRHYHQRQQQQHHQHHQQMHMHTNGTAPNTPQHQNYYNLTYVATDGGNSASAIGGASVIGFSAQTSNASRSNSPSPSATPVQQSSTLLSSCSSNSSISNVAATNTSNSPKSSETFSPVPANMLSYNSSHFNYPQHQQQMFGSGGAVANIHHLAQQHHPFQHNFMNKKLLAPLTLTMPPPSPTATPPPSNAPSLVTTQQQLHALTGGPLNIICCSQLDEASTAAAVAAAAKSSANSIIAGNDCDSDVASSTHSCASAALKYNSLKTLASTNSSTTATTVHQRQQQKDCITPRTPAELENSNGSVTQKTPLHSPLEYNYCHNAIPTVHMHHQQQYQQISQNIKQQQQQIPQMYQSNVVSLLNMQHQQSPHNQQGSSFSSGSSNSIGSISPFSINEEYNQPTQSSSQQTPFYYTVNQNNKNTTSASSAAATAANNTEISSLSTSTNIFGPFGCKSFPSNTITRSSSCESDTAIIPAIATNLTTNRSCSSSGYWSPSPSNQNNFIYHHQHTQHHPPSIGNTIALISSSSSQSHSCDSSNTSNSTSPKLQSDKGSFEELHHSQQYLNSCNTSSAASACTSPALPCTCIEQKVAVGLTPIMGDDATQTDFSAAAGNLGAQYSKQSSSQSLPQQQQQQQQNVMIQQQTPANNSTCTMMNARNNTNNNSGIAGRGGSQQLSTAGQQQQSLATCTENAKIAAANSNISGLQQVHQQHQLHAHPTTHHLYPVPPPSLQTLPPQPHNLLYNNPSQAPPPPPLASQAHHIRALSSSSTNSSVHDFYTHTPPDRFLARAHLIEAKETPPNLLNNSKWDSLSQDIWKKFLQSQQTEETFKQKMRLWRYLYLIIKNAYPRYGLYLVGSTISGFGSDTSDVDMCLVSRTVSNIDPRLEALYNLTVLRDCLSKTGEFETFNLIEAKVPILRFRDRIHQLEVDLNFNNCVGIKNTHLLYCYSQLDWRLRPLVLVTKLWAQYHNINNAKNMTISSYSLVLMVIHFLQYAIQPPVLPCLHDMFPDKFPLLRSNDFGYVDMNETIGPYESKNSETVGELFLEFLEYYSCFDYSQFAISIRTGSVLPINLCRTAKSVKNDVHQWKELCIEEPFDLTNTARSVYDYETFERVKAVFMASWRVLQETLNLESVFTPLVVSPMSSHYISYNSTSDLDSTVTTQTSAGVGTESDNIVIDVLVANTDDANNRTIITNINENSIISDYKTAIATAAAAAELKCEEEKYVCTKSMLQENISGDDSAADSHCCSLSAGVDSISFASKLKFKNLNKENKRLINSSTSSSPSTTSASAQLAVSNRCLAGSTAKYNERNLAKLNPKKEITTTNVVCALTTSS